MEGATLGLAYGLKRFRDLGMNPTEIRLTGGGSKSSVWRQIAADCFNAEVVTLNTSEGAALGGAIQAAYAHANQGGAEKISYEQLCAKLVTLDESTRCKPNPENAAFYATAASPDGTTTVEIDGRHIGVGSFASARILVANG